MQTSLSSPSRSLSLKSRDPGRDEGSEGGGGDGQGGREESSDESTVISSQTSTLTRNNQGADEMSRQSRMSAADDIHSDELTESDDDSDNNDDVTHHDKLQALCEAVSQLDMSRHAHSTTQCLDSDTDYNSLVMTHHTDEELITCDKSTNTDQSQTSNTKQAPPIGSRLSNQSTAPGVRSSTIRRWQTFSPTVTGAAGMTNDDFRCRLSRSGSDNSARQRRAGGQFDRRAAERQSVRQKKTLLSTRHSSSTQVKQPKNRTSVDLELDLEAFKMRQSVLSDEITALKQLKRLLEESRDKGESEPEWLTEELQQFLLNTERTLPRHERGSSSNMNSIDELVERRLRKVLHEINRPRSEERDLQPHKGLDVMSFRKKMAFFTTVSSVVPPISNVHFSLPAETDSSTLRSDSSTLRSDNSTLGSAPSPHTMLTAPSSSQQHSPSKTLYITSRNTLVPCSSSSLHCVPGSVTRGDLSETSLLEQEENESDDNEESKEDKTRTCLERSADYSSSSDDAVTLIDERVTNKNILNKLDSQSKHS